MVAVPMLNRVPPEEQEAVMHHAEAMGLDYRMPAPGASWGSDAVQEFQQ
jgi:hypothetical protein